MSRLRSCLLPVLLAAILPIVGCDDSDAPGVGSDASADAPPGDTPDAGADGGIDATPPGPFPTNPTPGEFAWAVVAPGAGDPVSVAVDAAGRSFVVANQTGELTLGNIHLAAPTTAALLVLAVDADGKPLWARSLAGPTQVNARGIATTPGGDLIIVGEFAGALPDFGTGPAVAGGKSDGFVARLSGDNGATAWVKVLGGPTDSLFSEDEVTGVAAGEGDAIYVLAGLSKDAVVDGQTVAEGSYLVRYDGDGTLRWMKNVPIDDGFDDQLALDPTRGPVVVGRFFGTIELGGQTLEAVEDFSGADDQIVIGYDEGGEVRFARPLASEQTSYYSKVATGPGGHVYAASETESGAVLVDGHALFSAHDHTSNTFMVELDADGHHVAHATVSAAGLDHPYGVAADADGAAYMIMTCDGVVRVQPEIACEDRSGGVVVSYGPDHAYRWSTYVDPAWLQALAPAPGHRLVVAGQAFGDPAFGGVHVGATHGGLFVAAIATGVAAAPSPLPAAPVVTDVTLDGVPDRQIRHGDVGTLVVHGEGLEGATSARVGDIDVHIPPGAMQDGALRLPFEVPHGHEPGFLTFTLGNAGGSATVVDAIRVTPVVLAPSGSPAGRGTFASPWNLCFDDLFLKLRFSDVVLLKNGVHACADSVFVAQGVTVRGESKTGVIVRGSSTGSSFQFEGFGVLTGAFGVTRFENLTIESAVFSAIRVFDAQPIAVTDVDIRGISGSGIWIESGAEAVIRRYRYLDGSGTGIVALDGDVDAEGIEVSGAFKGIILTTGSLRLASSRLSATDRALTAGSENNHDGPTRQVVITNSVLRSHTYGIEGADADIVIEGSTLEGIDDAVGGVLLQGGRLTMRDSDVRGFTYQGLQLTNLPGGIGFASLDPDTVSAVLDGVVVDDAQTAIFFIPGFEDTTSRLEVRHSRLHGTLEGLVVFNGFQAVDLGTAASPGDNEITAPSFAIVDGRNEAGPSIDAHGTRLNGTTETGDVLGPVVSAPAYKIAGPNTIRF